MTTSFKAGIIGVGSYLPERRLTNIELEQDKNLQTSDEWIATRTGIRERRIAASDESTSDMAVKASWVALERAGKTPQDVDLILVATITPDTPMPSTACWVQAKLGAAKAAAFDISAACSGFLYGLSVAKALVENGTNKCILLIGAEKLSVFLDWTDRTTCVLFGDGAGAAVIVPVADGKGEILSTYLSASGTEAELLKIPAGGSSMPATLETVEQHQHTIKMHGKEVFKMAVKAMADATLEAMRLANVPVEKLDWMIPHQANLRIITAMADRLDFPMDKIFLNVDKMGNTSAASVIIALDEAVTKGLVKQGQYISMVAFGAGTTLGSALVKW